MTDGFSPSDDGLAIRQTQQEDHIQFTINSDSGHYSISAKMLNGEAQDIVLSGVEGEVSIPVNTLRQLIAAVDNQERLHQMVKLQAQQNRFLQPMGVSGAQSQRQLLY